MQKGWIGLKKGYNVKFDCVNNIAENNNKIEVFVEDIEALKTAKFIIKRSDIGDDQ